MSIAKTYTAELIGLSTEIITVEVDISNGLNSFSVVGLGDRAVDEAKDRIAAAIKNSGYESPKQKNQKVVISLAPADLRKEGTSFDLAMAVAYLSASEEIWIDPEGKLFLGELSLEGRLRKVGGLLPILCQAARLGFKQAFIPPDNAVEASLAQGIEIYTVSALEDLIQHVNGTQPLCRHRSKPRLADREDESQFDMCMIRGNESAKRGLEIAAAGGHNTIMYGPPGTGKTILAQCFPSILPTLSYEESVEVTGIHSAARTLDGGLISLPPFRAPHHTASYPSVVGGGAFPKPGEITLAHRGVLFLDEFPEFDRSVIEALRQPLEERCITISRARGVLTFPAQCILLASMNPCPCGKGKDHGCTCSLKALEGYRRKISGPIMDRIDIWLDVSKVDFQKLGSKNLSSEKSRTIRERVTQARSIQARRFADIGSKKTYNTEMNARDIEQLALLEDNARSLLIASATRMQLSGRAFHRIIKVGRTIADLAASRTIQEKHILEALQYREKPAPKPA